MPFIGNQPALSYTSFAKQDFTTSATTSYTLDNPVANANELALFINFVRQEPTTAYSASGTSLTLTSATSATDDMYCVYLGKAVQTVNPPNGSVGLSQLTATGTKDATTFLRGDNTFAVAGGTNTPAFAARNAAAQTLSANTATLMQFDTEVFDTDGTYTNSSTFKFTPAVSGKYFIYSSISFDDIDNSEGTLIYLYKNGAEISLGGSSMLSVNFQADGSNVCQSWLTAIVDSDTDDYFQIYAKHTDDTSNPTRADYGNIFMAYKIIE
jgi:hypothetical protein